LTIARASFPNQLNAPPLVDGWTQNVAQIADAPQDEIGRGPIRLVAFGDFMGRRWRDHRQIDDETVRTAEDQLSGTATKAHRAKRSRLTPHIFLEAGFHLKIVLGEVPPPPPSRSDFYRLLPFGLAVARFHLGTKVHRERIAAMGAQASGLETGGHFFKRWRRGGDFA
jgi:hypothetical protein